MRLSDFEQRKMDAEYSEHMDAVQRDRERPAAAMQFEVCLALCLTLHAQMGFRRMMNQLAPADPRTRTRVLASALVVALTKNEWPEL